MSVKFKSLPSFIYLELLDPEIYALLNGLNKIFGEVDALSSIHITVRGPYHQPVKKEILDQFQMILGHEPILVHGIGMFENSEYVVYIKINHDNLGKIWWKPDYPNDHYGFNPHITIYKGRDKLLAKQIFSFLKNEELALLCHEYRLSSYISKQYKLFPEHDSSSSQNFDKLCKLQRIRPDILERARALVINYKTNSDNNSLDMNERKKRLGMENKKKSFK